jgi:YgiT-type zinc finger domain-containing protein
MSATPRDPLSQAQQELASWHATHPDATFAEIEAAVEAQVDRMRVQLVQDRMAPRIGEAHPVCPQCGSQMEPRSTKPRTIVLKGDQELTLEREYLTCPQCGAGVFPPG